MRQPLRGSDHAALLATGRCSIRWQVCTCIFTPASSLGNRDLQALTETPSPDRRSRYTRASRPSAHAMRLLLQTPSNGSVVPAAPPAPGDEGGGSNNALAISLGVILGFFGIKAGEPRIPVACLGHCQTTVRLCNPFLCMCLASTGACVRTASMRAWLGRSTRCIHRLELPMHSYPALPPGPHNRAACNATTCVSPACSAAPVVVILGFCPGFSDSRLRVLGILWV